MPLGLVVPKAPGATVEDDANSEELPSKDAIAAMPNPVEPVPTSEKVISRAESYVGDVDQFMALNSIDLDGDRGIKLGKREEWKEGAHKMFVNMPQLSYEEQGIDVLNLNVEGNRETQCGVSKETIGHANRVFVERPHPTPEDNMRQQVTRKKG
ncbi:hypothetical protein U1Q18_025674 [Sarracenia purpurea var. burkii]